MSQFFKKKKTKNRTRFIKHNKQFLVIKLSFFSVHYVDKEPYSRTQTKQKLMDHQADEVSFHDISGIEIIVTLQRKAKKLWNQLKKKN